MNIYVLRVEHDDGTTTKLWSRSKLEMIDHGQRHIRETSNAVRSVVFRVTYTDYESPRQLVVKLLNKSKTARTLSKEWQQKRQPTKGIDVLSIEPFKMVEDIVPNV